LIENIDHKVVEEFGNEWSEFDQSELSEDELISIFNDYFRVFPWENVSKSSVGFDLGCGSGRWAKFVSPKVGKLFCIDPSNAIEIAKKNLKKFKNCSFIKSGVDQIPLEDNSMDFGYSLGVLHHVPDTADGLKKAVSKLKKGAPFLVYLYYAMDNQPIWYKFIWKISDFFRKAISSLPFKSKLFITNTIALLIYFPLARFSNFLFKIGVNVHSFPLSNYRNKSFYTMRTDALDRFGTKLELRYTRNEIQQMMITAGLINIIFSNSTPYWCAVGIKK
jgi:ubiquinone/menaquinone biosynthesis C-methylase UbiE